MGFAKSLPVNAPESSHNNQKGDRIMITWNRVQNPWDEMYRLNRDFRRLLEDWNRPATTSEFPPVNISTNSEEAVLAAEVPGVDPDKLEITVQGDVVTLKGRRELPESKADESCLRQERFGGEFTRSFNLPFTVDRERVAARYEKGVLCLTLPRREEEKPRKISVVAA
jgi:HSP20 family protein